MSASVTTNAAQTPKKELLRGIVAAAAIAAVLLTTAVLPAEYGLDPTGVGRILGLTALNQTAPSPSNGFGTPAMVSNSGPMSGATENSGVSAAGEARQITIAGPQELAYRTDEMEVTLPPGRGLEVKTHLAKGATLIYSWKTVGGELVNHDFHGEPINAGKDEFESFILGKGVKESRGTLVAPFTGLHGWYWKNTSNAPVTVKLQASGFYSDILKK